MNIIISIGFLRGAALMSTSEQVNFIRDIKNTLDLALNGLERQMVQQGACTGYWEGEEEPSYTCTTAVLLIFEASTFPINCFLFVSANLYFPLSPKSNSLITVFI